MSWSAADRFPQAVAARVTTPPIMDGKLDDPAWSSAAETDGFSVLGDSSKHPRVQTFVKAVTDGTSLYLGFRCVEPRVAEIKTTVVPHDGDVYMQESVDIVIDPLGDGLNSYHLITNLAEGQFDSRVTAFMTGASKEDDKWNGDWETKASRGDKEWYVEMKIPFSTIGADLTKNSIFRINFSRVSRMEGEENSIWGLNRIRFVEPSNMGELIIPNADGSYCQIKFPRLASISIGTQKVPIEILNRSNSTIKPVLSYRLSGSKISEGIVRYGEIAAGKRLTGVYPFTVAEQGSHVLHMDVIDSLSGKSLYSIDRTIQVTQPISFDEALYALYHKRADADIEVLVPYAGAKLIVSLLKNGSSIDSKTFKSLPNGRVKASFNLKGKSKGTYVMRAELVRGGKTLAVSRSRKYVYSPTPKIGFNKDGFLLVEGKPFFPIGIYSLRRSGRDAEAMHDGKQAGFNSTVLYDDSPARLIPLLDLCEQNGIKAFVYPTVPFSVRKSAVTLEQVHHDLDVRKNHPALLGWYVVDEPEGIGMAPVEPVRNLYQDIKEYDTEHPCALVVMEPEAAKDYRPATDIMWVDPYPIPKRPVTLVSEVVAGSILNIEKDKPLWCVPQAFDWSVWETGKIKDGIHRPTDEEERCMTYLALVNGSKGIIYWAYTSSAYNIWNYPDHWVTMKKLAGELRDLTPALTTPTINGKLTISPKIDAVRTMLKKANGEWYVFTVNSSDKPASASMHLSGLPDGAKIEVLFEGRSLSPVNGGWNDGFKPLEAHIYKIAAH